MEKTKRNKVWLLIDLLIVIAGIFLCFSFTLSTYEYNQKNKTYLPVEGIVISTHYNKNNQAAIVVEYKIDRKRYTTISSRFEDTPLSIGAAVDLKYNPKDVSDVLFLREKPNIMYVIVGGLLLILGVLDLLGIIGKFVRKYITPLSKIKTLLSNKEMFYPKEEPKQVVEEPKPTIKVVDSMTTSGTTSRDYLNNNKQPEVSHVEPVVTEEPPVMEEPVSVVPESVEPVASVAPAINEEPEPVNKFINLDPVDDVIKEEPTLPEEPAGNKFIAEDL